jgi:hypothetical protein
MLRAVQNPTPPILVGAAETGNRNRKPGRDREQTFSETPVSSLKGSQVMNTLSLPKLLLATRGRGYRASIRVCGILLSISFAAWSQMGISFPDTAPERGVSPVGSYSFDKLEAISKSSGVLTYTIPLTTMPLGRGGMSIPINFTYNSSQYDYSYSYTYNTSPPNAPILNQHLQNDSFGGWSVTTGYSLYLESKPLATSNDCTINLGVQRTSLLMPDGSRHVLQFYGFPQGFTGDGTGYYPWSYSGATACTNYSSLNGDVTLFYLGRKLHQGSSFIQFGRLDRVSA